MMILLIGACNNDNNDDDDDINTPPTASFTVNPNSGNIQTVFSVDASNSTDNEQLASELEVRWDWTADGSWDTDYSTSKTATHQYPAAGDFTIRLEVKDKEGATGTSSQNVNVIDDGSLSFLTGTVSNITLTSAEITGEIISTGQDQITDHGHCWSFFGDPDINSSKTLLGSVTSPGSFTSIITGLTEQIAYDVRAYVTTNQGTVYGELVSFNAATSAGITPCPGAETVSDADGNVYNTVLINGVCWMRENLRVGTMINGAQEQQDNGTTEKYCYDNDDKHCEIFGGLYQWNEMMQYVTGEINQGICPDGWHLPTHEEIQTLDGNIADAYDLISVGQCQNSNNISGFSALLSGYKGYIPPSFVDYGTTTELWSTKRYAPQPTVSSISYSISGDGSSTFATPNQLSAFSVRCIKDN